MSRYARGIFIAMEDNEVEEMTPDMDAELESNVAEISEDGRDIEDGVEALESAMEDLDTLEDITDVMEDSVESGEGLDEDAAEIAQVAVESIYRRLGIRKGAAMPSMESFGSASSRVHATKIAMEGFGETIKAAWEKIKEFFKDLIDKLVLFFKRLNKGLVMLKKSAVDLKKKASAMSKDAKPAATAFSNDKFAMLFFNKGNKLEIGLVKTAVTETKELVEHIVPVTDAVVKSNDDITKAIKQILDNLAKKKAERADTSAAGLDTIQTTIAASAAPVQVKLKTFLTGKTFIDGITLSLSATDTDATNKVVGFDSLVKITPNSKLAKISNSTIKVPTPEEVAGLADAVEASVDALEKALKVESKLGEMKKKIDNLADVIIKSYMTKEEQSGDALKTTREAVNLTKRSIMKCNTFATQFISTTIPIGVKTAKEAIRFGHVCLGQLKVEN